MWCSALNVLAIFAASVVSSILSANLIEMAWTSISGLTLRISDKTNVESTPPLNAIEIFFPLNFSIFFAIELQIDFSIISELREFSVGTKSSHVFLGRLGVIEGS